MTELATWGNNDQKRKKKTLKKGRSLKENK